MIVIGLTGSIGMGKSTTTHLFADEGVAICDSDAIVHSLYENEAVRLIESAFSGTTNGSVDRSALSDRLRENPANFSILEKIVHPLVLKKQQQFLDEERQAKREFALLDIPLLFETGAESRVDVVVVVSCDEDIQRRRVLSRPGMTEEKFAMILTRQMPDIEKRKKADFVIDTGHGIEEARLQVRDVLTKLRTGNKGMHFDA